ncbi:acyl-CoA dehydrogenase family protein, partial [Colwellia sp. E150_009]
MNFDLTEDQQMFADTAKQFSNSELLPNAAKWDQEHTFPKDIIAKAGELGFCALYTPEEAGGLNLSRLDSSIIFEQLAMGCTATTAMMTIHNMATWMIATWGKDVFKDAWCPSLVTGEKLASYCLTEPGSGSDAASLSTSAKKEGDHYVINGSKVFISGAGATD